MGFLCMSAVLYTFWHKSGYKNVHATVQNYELLGLFVCLFVLTILRFRTVYVKEIWYKHDDNE